MNVAVGGGSREDPSHCQWLLFEVDNEGKKPLVILASQPMIKDAIARGHREPSTWHGIQRYGLKVVTVHAKDVEGGGSHQ
jgi:hypothetical protein